MPFFLFHSLFFGYLGYLATSGYLWLPFDTLVTSGYRAVILFLGWSAFIFPLVTPLVTFGYLLIHSLGRSAFFFGTFIVFMKAKSFWSSFSGTLVSKKSMIRLFLLLTLVYLGEEVCR